MAYFVLYADSSYSSLYTKTFFSMTTEILKKDRTSPSFWNSNPPLTSKRVSIILSDPRKSSKLADTVRSIRHQERLEGTKEMATEEVKTLHSTVDR